MYGPGGGGGGGVGGRGGRGYGQGHRAGQHSYSGSIAGQKAQLTTAYTELGRELSSTQIKVVGNYTLGRVIGEGSFGKVRLAINKLTSHRCAVKQIPRSVAPPLLTREIHHHRRLHHPNVLQLFEVIATEGSIWLVSELCPGGELFDYLVEKGRLGEHEARRMFGQLCLGVGYIHAQGVVHRDLKLENILLDERCNVKIADFGFGREFEQRRLMETFCGTTGYAAPEMLAGKKYLGEEVDVWSMGVILYALLTGSLPFDDDDEDVMKEKIQVGQYDMPEWLGDDSQDLISRILRLEPRDRITIREILAHDWFTRPSVMSPPMPSNDYFQFADFVPEAIPEEASSPSADHQHADTEGAHSPPSPKSLSRLASANQQEQGQAQEQGQGQGQGQVQHQQELSGASSVASTSSWHSAATTNESDVGLGIRHTSRSATPLTSDESEGAHDSPDRMDSAPLDKGKGREIDPASSLCSSSAADVPPVQYAARIPRNASQVTITRSDSRRSMHRYSPLPGSSAALSSGESPSQSFRFPPPSPAMLDNLPHGSPALPIPAHSRTPSRTKRRSVGSTMSERMHNSAGTHEQPALPNYLELLAASTSAPAPFSTALEKQLLESLAVLGLDTGQMVHSVRADACDSSGAIWWMLKHKAEQREADNAHDAASIGPAKSASGTSIYQQQQRYEDRRSDRAADSGDEAASSSRKQSLDLSRASTNEANPPVVQPLPQPQPLCPPAPASPSPFAAASPFASASAAGSQGRKDAPLEYGGPAHTPSPRKARPPSSIGSISAPMLTPIAKARAQVGFTPPLPESSIFISSSGGGGGGGSSSNTSIQASPARSTETSKTVPARLTKPRSASVSTVSMLQRATSVIGAAVTGGSSSSGSRKDKGDEANLGSAGPEARSTPNLLSGGLFGGRKVSSTGPALAAAAEKPALNERKSSEKSRERISTGESSESVPQNKSGPSTPSLQSSSAASSAGATPLAPLSPVKATPLNLPRDSPGAMSTASKESLGSYIQPASHKTEASLRDSIMSTSSTSAASSTGTARSTGGAKSGKNLFSSLKLWLQDERRKQKRHRQSSAPHMQAGQLALGQSPRSGGHATLPVSSSSGSIRQQHPHIHAPSPLQRPPIARMPSNSPSSAAISRRNSSTSARRIPMGDPASPLLGHGYGHARRRSDASRKSFSSIQGSRTPVEPEGDRETEAVSHSRPQSSLSNHPASSSADLYAAARKRHARGSSTSSAGSRHSTMISGSPIATYRRTPAVTQVRRISTPKNHNHHRQPSSASQLQAQAAPGQPQQHPSHSRSHSVPSSISSRASSISEGGPPAASGSGSGSGSGDALGASIIIEEESESMTESMLVEQEKEREKALRKLSGTGPDLIGRAALAVPGYEAVGSVPLVASPEPIKPSALERRPSADSSGGRGRSRSSQSHGTQSGRRSSGNSQTSSGQHGGHHAVFAAHKVVNPFGTPNGSHYTPHASTSASHGHRHSRDGQRPKLRDVFKNKKAEGEDGWVDEDDSLVSYTGGFGQTSASSGPGGSAGGAGGSGATPFANRSSTDFTPGGGAGALGMRAPDSPAAFPVLGEGRYAGLSLSRGGDNLPSSASREGGTGAPSSGSWRGGGGGQTVRGPAFKRAAIVEEEEEEEE